MKTIKYPNKNTWSEILKRPTQTVNDIESTVNQIFEDVQRNGDAAIKKYTSLFDGADLQYILVTEQEIKDASAELSTELKSAINQAKSNIETFHKAQKTKRVSVETSVGITCWQEKRAIQKVGIYIPAGTAPLFSTVLMFHVHV